MNRTVAFIDILGFKNKINEQSANDLGKNYKRAIRYALEKYQVNLNSSKEPSFFTNISKGDEYCISYIFSDSIILASFDDTEINTCKLLIFTYRLMRTMIVQGFLVRGGISYGDMYIDLEDSIFVGTALTQAYELEMKQEWIGVTIHENVVNAFPNIFNGSYKYGNYLKNILVKYQVPMKYGEIRNLYTINWRWNLIVEKGTKSLFGKTNDWASKVKIDNTLNYTKYIRNSSLDYPFKPSECPIEIRALYVAEGKPRKIMPKHGDEY
jgi:hypothetical protein